MLPRAATTRRGAYRPCCSCAAPTVADPRYVAQPRPGPHQQLRSDGGQTICARAAHGLNADTDVQKIDRVCRSWDVVFSPCRHFQHGRVSPCALMHLTDIRLRDPLDTPLAAAKMAIIVQIRQFTCQAPGELPFVHAYEPV